MLDNHACLLALRNQLLTTQAATTGTTSLEATADGYRRVAGDFVTDGFVVGEELLPAGFAENPPAVIRAVTAKDIKLRKTHPAQADGAGRSLTVGIPSLRNWENISKQKDRDLWHITEEYIPSPQNQNTVGPLGWVDEFPIYVIKFRGHSGIGSAALYKVADAALASFPPRDALTLADSTVLRVRSKPGPGRGQVMQDEDGFSVVVVTIPIWARTQNII